MKYNKLRKNSIMRLMEQVSSTANDIIYHRIAHAENIVKTEGWIQFSGFVTSH